MKQKNESVIMNIIITEEYKLMVSIINEREMEEIISIKKDHNEHNINLMVKNNDMFFCLDPQEIEECNNHQLDTIGMKLVLLIVSSLIS